MFRPMRRIKQQLAEDEALEVLKSAKRGVLSVIGDDGWPYGIHLNPYWEDGRLYFHGAKAGHKIDALRRDSRASFTAIDDGEKDDGGWAYTFRSVVVFGRVKFIDDQTEAIEICRRLSRRFTQNEKYIEDEIKVSDGFPIPNPSLTPAIERDFENVPVTKRFEYFLTKGTALTPPKSIYASSTITTLSGFDFTILSISQMSRHFPVGALGLAITTVLFTPM